MKRQLYDLAAADESVRFSPYCWRIKLALAHKNLAYESLPWHFTETDKIAFSGQSEVPVLVDGAVTIHDSQAIAEYLEATYPNEASLFGDPPGRGLSLFIKQWTEDTLHPVVARIVLPDVFPRLAAKDQPYFRASREARFGKTIEAMKAEQQSHLPALAAALKPLRHTLQAQPFIAGDAPAYADHIVFGALQWATMMSSTPLLAPDDPIIKWMQAVFETYGL